MSYFKSKRDLKYKSKRLCEPEASSKSASHVAMNIPRLGFTSVRMFLTSYAGS